MLALDLGDVWVGTAISDELGITARPYRTVTAKELVPFLAELFVNEAISTVVIGYPKTMRGTESEQTKKVLAQKESLAEKFPHIEWTLWDERLSSKHADQLKRAKTKEEKVAAHSVAAAFILTGYLLFASQRF